jgi:YebC/PmpR family DNA-binding regulatory protein
MSGHSKWSTIKRKKEKIDSQRGKVFTRLAKEIIIAARQGGADLNANMRLKAAVQRAKEANIPNENIKRAIQKGSGELAGVNYEEITYEGYGPGGVAVMLEIMTDNRNRTAGEIRHLFSKYGGNLGETGCVSWMFDKKGLLVVDKTETALSEDDLMLTALDVGAEDVKDEEDSYEITTSPDDLDSVREALNAQGIPTVVAEVSLIPQNTVKLTGDDADRMLTLMDLLEEHDDVQNAYANFDIEE